MLTDNEIRALRDVLFARAERGVDSKEDREAHARCESALNEMCHPPRRREAREWLEVFATAERLRTELAVTVKANKQLRTELEAAVTTRRTWLRRAFDLGLAASRNAASDHDAIFEELYAELTKEP